ncbi:MAG: orotate phosphoribosyltransferase [Candidatus Nitronauta litoralis]|uniref:Orotate phosphoribosyltransferase n=1 Tax=Candidatus Nitronauta litoralis TaxID=2705533 RepID=A0A7T0BXX6_9BACT|nr:MAG: orotate phosphoribosyltransferase [Candidatus Nitronauta litoralis]
MPSELDPPVSIQLAKIALDLGAIKISPENPFTWASGARMPIYNDNRLLLGDSSHRQLVAEGFQAIIDSRKIPTDVIAGTATAGIPHATTLANRLQCPLIYVRPTPKEHGMKNQIEGPLDPGKNVVVVEDLISTGGSVLKVVHALREAGVRVQHCMGIFSYGFPDTIERFNEKDCQLHTLIQFEELLDFMKSSGKLSSEQLQTLMEWKDHPFEWWEKKK